MFLFTILCYILTIICFTIVGIILYTSAKQFNFSEVFKSKEFWGTLIVGLVWLFFSIVGTIKTVQYIQNDAIVHYLNGDFKIVEKSIDGEIVDTYFMISDIDYD